MGKEEVLTGAPYQIVCACSAIENRRVIRRQARGIQYVLTTKAHHQNVVAQDLERSLFHHERRRNGLVNIGGANRCNAIYDYQIIDSQCLRSIRSEDRLHIKRSRLPIVVRDGNFDQGR